MSVVYIKFTKKVESSRSLNLISISDSIVFFVKKLRGIQ